MIGERRFTREELLLYNGKDGAPAYIAYKGNVYDVPTGEKIEFSISESLATLIRQPKAICILKK